MQSQTPSPKPNPSIESDSPGGPFGKSLSSIAKNIQQIEVEEIETIEDNTYPTFTNEPVVIKQTDFPRNGYGKNKKSTFMSETSFFSTQTKWSN